ncbi:MULTISPECIES: carboxylesterase/lipase family protein [Mycobacterium]|uniref:Carboxylic ester hydrolase n=1 Tax=Mycobacterium syngnathidarum TaxID=1908205 RepID=A0A1S1K1M3_9MYCO|nr:MULTISPECIES: carboxylesterase family protein [Mycobacterium]MCG7607827.1 carboxylesterase family protein [Mycobacterium sp. CnD-18-1]OHU00768.1 carboxylesterase [Mycobacterium syngnathidarum]
MSQNNTPVVRTPSGAVGGVRDHSGERYCAIPYAATPTGAARFAPPAPHPGWDGIRDATGPGATAPQPVRDFGALDMRPYFGPGWVRGADYLTLDVRTPAADDAARPVMVFVHGGGFVTGSSQAALYDGRAFTRDGVVLVTLNYRLGVSGFLDVPGAMRNRGLLDVLAALRWVRDTISAFGGDPGNVTLAGQSAGATLVAGMLATPDAAGLFRQAVMQSGSGTGAFTPEQAARVTRAATAELGVEPTADGLADIPDEQFVAVLPRLAGLDLRTATATDPLVGLSPFSLVLDRQPADALGLGPAADVALLIGTNTREGNLYLVPQGAFDTSRHGDVVAVAAQTHSDPQATVDGLAARLPHATHGELRSALLADALFGSGSARMARAHSLVSARGTYVYRFGFHSTAVDGKLGAAHTVELPFVFDIADSPWLHGNTGLLGPDVVPEGLARRMHSSWVSFARNGSPGWDGYRGDDAAVQHFE